MKKEIKLCLSGCLLGCSFLSPFLSILSIPACMLYIHTMMEEKNLRQSLKLQFMFSFFYHLLGFSFILSAARLEVVLDSFLERCIVLVLGWLLLSTILSIWYLLIPFILNGFHHRSSYRFLLLVCAYALIEKGMEYCVFGLPWLRLGLNLVNFPILPSCIGVFGSSIMMLLISYLFLLVYKRKRYWTLGLILVFILLTLPLSSSMEGTKVTLIQPNISVDDKWSDVTFDTSLLNQVEGLGVLCESVVIDAKNIENEILQEHNAYLIYGLLEEKNNEYFNSLVTNYDTNVYQKQILVPIGEYMPSIFKDVLPFLNEINLGNEITKGQQSDLFTFEDLKIGSNICFEDIYPRLFHQHVRKEANVFLVASNDSWFNSSELYIHILHARMRAIEEGRAMMRVGNTSGTLLIDEKGRIVDELEKDISGVLHGEISISNKRTVYSILGRYLPIVCLLLIVLQLKGIKKEEFYFI